MSDSEDETMQSETSSVEDVQEVHNDEDMESEEDSMSYRTTSRGQAVKVSLFPTISHHTTSQHSIIVLILNLDRAIRKRALMMTIKKRMKRQKLSMFQSAPEQEEQEGQARER